TYGYDGTTVNQICQEHNIPKGLIYYNFKNKKELYLCCIDRAVEAFIAYMEDKEFKTDFKLYMQERYKFFKNNPNYSRLIFGIILTDNNDFSDKVKRIKDKFDSFNYNIYLQAVDSLRLRSGVSRDDAIEYYGLLQNMLNSYLSTDISASRYFDLAVSGHEKMLEKILDYMLYGIAEEEK
ncbi:MAG: TetR/AcrR family transcriptional regulator, partial [Eubacterium sp.]